MCSNESSGEDMNHIQQEQYNHVLTVSAASSNGMCVTETLYLETGSHVEIKYRVL